MKMSSCRREEERNEKIIRGLLKLPPNRKCINCNSLGPQYVCTNFWIFICVTCSGIHREFTHRVKSVSMAKFTSQEVEALQKGGNQRAREIFLKDWDMERKRLPDSGNIDKIREFIKNVYVDKKYVGESSSGKPPRDTHSNKKHEDHRRASSYHSFSQSPPYEDQYEERCYGKQTATLSRKPGSDRGYYEGKISSFIYSAGHQGEELYEDKFANETSSSRVSDYSNASVACVGDPFQPDGKSLKIVKTGYSSPPLRQVRDILNEDTHHLTFSSSSKANIKIDKDVIPCPQRTASSGSFGSFDSNSASLVSFDSSSFVDNFLEPEYFVEAQKPDVASIPSPSQISVSANAINKGLFTLPVTQQQPASSALSTDLFQVSHLPSSATPSVQNPLANPFSESVGWAMFDIPHQAAPVFETNKEHNTMMSPIQTTVKGNECGSLFMNNNSQWFQAQNAAHDPLSFLPNQQHELIRSADSNNSTQTWNAFGDPNGNVPQTTHGTAAKTNEEQLLRPKLPMSDEPFTYHRALKIAVEDSFQPLAVNEFATRNLPFDSLSGSLFDSSVPPLKEGITPGRKSTNPFDLPEDSGLEANNVYLDMSSLQTALPSSQLHIKIRGDLPQTWFPQNPVISLVSSVPQGGLAYLAGHLPGSPLQDIPSQVPAASIGGNPFM